MLSCCRHSMCCLALCTVSYAGPLSARADDAALPPSREQIEADWLRQDTVRGSGPVQPEQDAVGACDGVKNGGWGFHTALENDPWWQIDLGDATPLDHIAIYNRCDHTAGRAAQLAVCVSTDGRAFRQIYQHDGTVFLGQPDGKPLQVRCEGQLARYVRLQVPGNNCLHLDEVEVFAAGNGDNIARGRPVTQSSVCEWSTRKDVSLSGNYPTQTVVQQGVRLAESLQQLDQQRSEAPSGPISAQSGSFAGDIQQLQEIAQAVEQLSPAATDTERRELYLRARWKVRRMALSNPLLDFDDLVIVRGRPASGRTCRTNTWAGGRSREAVYMCCTISKRTTHNCSA